MFEKVIRAPMMRPTMSERGVKLCAEVVVACGVGATLSGALGRSPGEIESSIPWCCDSEALPAILRVW